MSQEIPGSIRIRTDDGNEWRFDEIERAADWYSTNRSNAAAFACHDVLKLVKAAEQVLRRDDLTRKQRREIAATMSTGNIRFGTELEISAEKQRD